MRPPRRPGRHRHRRRQGHRPRHRPAARPGRRRGGDLRPRGAGDRGDRRRHHRGGRPRAGTRARCLGQLAVDAFVAETHERRSAAIDVLVNNAALTAMSNIGFAPVPDLAGGRVAPGDRCQSLQRLLRIARRRPHHARAAVREHHQYLLRPRPRAERPHPTLRCDKGRTRGADAQPRALLRPVRRPRERRRPRAYRRGERR